MFTKIADSDSEAIWHKTYVYLSAMIAVYSTCEYSAQSIAGSEIRVSMQNFAPYVVLPTSHIFANELIRVEDFFNSIIKFNKNIFWLVLEPLDGHLKSHPRQVQHQPSYSSALNVTTKTDSDTRRSNRRKQTAHS